MKSIFAAILLLIMAGCQIKNPANLTVTLADSKPTANVVALYENCDKGGNTSLAFDKTDIYKWSMETSFAHESWGYFDLAGNEIPYIKRDRDLGQTFQIDVDKPVLLRSVVVQTGYGDNVVRPGMFGQALSLQIFEVSGNKVLNNNGSNENTEAFHGFPHNRAGDSIPTLRDDYFEGETFNQVAVIRGGKFPEKTSFGFAENDSVSPDDPKLKGKFIEFKLPEVVQVTLQPGKQYAFLLMIDEMGDNRGFTLANHYIGEYTGGHGIRRDGNGIFPPVPANPAFNFTDPENAAALASAHFPVEFEKRTTIQPGTNGYPDVCTWRDLVFYIVAR
jgi:hypothetical protein